MDDVRREMTKVIETALREKGWLDSADAEDAAPEVADALILGGF